MIHSLELLSSGYGADGQVPVFQGGRLVPGDVGTNTAGRQHKNAIINGCFRVRQRGGAGFHAGTTPANNDDTWLTDRWLLLSDGNDIVDITPELSDLPDGAYNAEEFTIQTGNKKFGYAQILEHRDAARLFDGGNGTVSVSFDMKAPATVTDVRVVVLAWTSTADTVTSDLVSAWNAGGSNPTWATNWTAENTPANLNPTTSWARYSVEGIALDTSSTTNIAVFIWNNDTTTTATQQLRIANVQLERGDKATEFEFRHRAEELMLVSGPKRYFIADDSSGQSVNNITATLVSFDTETADPFSEYDNSASNYKYTPTLPGVYQVNLSVKIDVLADQKQFSIYIYKNGSLYQEVNRFFMGATNDCIAFGSALVEMNGTDYLQAYCYHNHGSARTVTGIQFDAVHVATI